MIDKLVKFLLLISPIAYGVNINLNKFSMRFFQIGVMALFAISLLDEPKRSIKFLAKPIILLIGILILNSFWHFFQPLDTRNIEDLFFGILAITIIVKYLTDVKSCYKYIYWALGINFVVMLLQKIGYAPAVGFSCFGSYVRCEGGFFGFSGELAMYATIVGAFIPILAFIPIAIWGLLCHETTILIPIGILAFNKIKNKYLAGGIIASSMLILYKSIWASILFRWEHSWKWAIDMICKQPLLGYGLGAYTLLTGRESFCSYVPFIFGLGALGAFWLGYIIKLNWKNFDKNKESMAVISLLLLCLVEYPFEVARLWFTIIFVISIWLIKQEVVKNESNL